MSWSEPPSSSSCESGRERNISIFLGRRREEGEERKRERENFRLSSKCHVRSLRFPKKGAGRKSHVSDCSGEKRGGQILREKKKRCVSL